jgi:hypothetical protein
VGALTGELIERTRPAGGARADRRDPLLQETRGIDRTSDACVKTRKEIEPIAPGGVRSGPVAGHHRRHVRQLRAAEFINIDKRGAAADRGPAAFRDRQVLEPSTRASSGYSPIRPQRRNAIGPM